ncbi:hypothetical protein [Sunxiuqinia dokdonensis]|uniref:Uncharacterized protein n=1 Tax=Sunxiuqinia dokdonensis TaxID=1409788 RepID=A0A0L8VC73_9BACT|nr:hypothetical protein [Sunxiuqinia dokdonensis]KOH45958.1 hypothetical protein NC99_12030 [Sunxiuqinia dokdonensis]
MRKNVNVVAVLFEEVNTLLKTIDRKINDQHQNLEDAATKADLASEKIAIEKAFLQTSRNLSVLDQKLNQLLVSVQESEDQIRSGFESILSTLKDQENQRLARHQRQLKLKSKSVIMAFVFLFLLFTVSLIGNIYQRNELTRVSDNDLKYRYIKMVGGINADELSKLEELFHINKDKELIREIREQVEKFERENPEQIIELE